MSAKCTRAFENSWLSRYPWPMRVVHDQGSKFMGALFQDLLRRAGVKSVPMTACNPQDNSVVEVELKSMGQVLQTLVHVHNPQTVHQAKALPWLQLCMQLIARRIRPYVTLPLAPSHFIGTCFLIFLS